MERKDTYEYLGMTLNEQGNQDNQIIEMEKKSVSKMKEAQAINTSSEIGSEGLRMHLQLLKACKISALLYRLEVWDVIIKDEEMNKKYICKCSKKIICSSQTVDCTMDFSLKLNYG